MRTVIEKLGQQYDFLENNSHLGQNIMLLAYGGSHAYGTNTPASDVDIRGCTRNTAREILGISEFDRFADYDTDTVIYGFKRMVNLLLTCNPAIIEILGCKPEHYFYISEEGQMLLDHADIFLSGNCVFRAFGGYARQQEKDLIHKLSHKKDDAKLNKHAMHMVRSYYMAIDILEQGKIITYREKERKFLLSIRNGAFQKSDGTYQNEFFELIHSLENRMRYASQNTVLPQRTDTIKVEDLVMEINRRTLEKMKAF